jgi:hypothetical protein
MGDFYKLTFSVEGSMTVEADSQEEAEHCALDILQWLSDGDAEDFTPMSAVIRMRSVDRGHEDIEGDPICVEFGA